MPAVPGAKLVIWWRVKDKIVIVTGASAGIGRATAVAFAAQGAHVVVAARREDRLQDLAAEIAHYPGRCLVVPGDISQQAYCARLIAETIDQFGRLDVLVNNAGLGHHSALANIPGQDIKTIFDVNVLGMMFATQAVIPHMRRQGSGQIINVSSIVSMRPLTMSGAYCASKSAVNFLSRSLRMELHRQKIIITLIYPGLTATEFAAAKLGQPGARLGMRGIPQSGWRRKFYWP